MLRHRFRRQAKLGERARVKRGLDDALAALVKVTRDDQQVTASRRIGEPQDIADVALFLASPRSAYMNGAELAVDGGMSSMLMDMVPRPGFNKTA